MSISKYYTELFPLWQTWKFAGEPHRIAKQTSCPDQLAKTINDPCPVGYKVPVNDASGNTPYAWLKFASMTWDTVNYGATQDGQWFPATGTRVYEGGGLDSSTERGHSR